MAELVFDGPDDFLRVVRDRDEALAALEELYQANDRAQSWERLANALANARAILAKHGKGKGE